MRQLTSVLPKLKFKKVTLSSNSKLHLKTFAGYSAIKILLDKKLDYSDLERPVAKFLNRFLLKINRDWGYPGGD